MKMMYAIAAATMLVAAAASGAHAQLTTNPGDNCPPKSGDTYYIGHLGGQPAFLTAWLGTSSLALPITLLLFFSHTYTHTLTHCEGRVRVPLQLPPQPLLFFFVFPPPLNVFPVCMSSFSCARKKEKED